MGGLIDPYKILGVSDSADDTDIKRAYRQKSLKCHPDLFPDDPLKTAEFRQLTEAFEMIDTEDKRSALKSQTGVSLRKGPEGAQTEFYRKMFRVNE